MRRLKHVITAFAGLVTVSSAQAWPGPQAPLADPEKFTADACPDYRSYSQWPHGPYSDGKLGLPFMRPHWACRTFTSQAIEDVIADMVPRFKDPDLARLFENTFPSTTDTTIKWHTNGSETLRVTGPRYPFPAGKWEGPHTFVITGDIIAEWLRDSTNQLSPYLHLAKKDPALNTMILGAINTQSEYVIESPYCNAFQPPPISDLPVTLNNGDDVVHPVYELDFVFECKYELDSLAHFLALANAFHKHTGSLEFVTDRWYRAIDTVQAVLRAQSQPTFDPKTGKYRQNEYTFQRRTDTGTETLNLHGIGNPLNDGTGLVRSAFRPSDDATILGFFIPANAMMAVELNRTAAIMRKTPRAELAEDLEEWSARITQSIWEHGVVNHKKYGEVFAYEVDGYGSSIFMDDANYPSLLALPLMGFVAREDKVYQNTRRMLLEQSGNPYYLTGPQFKGIGGPHIGLTNAWPMSLLNQARTSEDDAEIEECINLVLQSSAKLGLIHESVNVKLALSYTRSWFAWANGVFAETILDLAERKPHLIFKDGKSRKLG